MRKSKWILNKLVTLFHSSKREIVWFFLLLLCLNAAASANPFSTKKFALSQVNNQILSLRETIVENQQRQATLLQQLKTIETTLGKLNGQLTHLTRALAEEQQILTSLKMTQQKMLAKLKLQNNALAEQLRATYQLGEMQHWKIMLNQENVGSMSRHVTYYRYLNLARLKLISQMKENLILLTQSIQASNMHQQTLKYLVAKKQRQQEYQQRTLDLRQKLIAALGIQTKTKQQQIDSLLQNQKALQETIAKLKEQSITISGQSFNQLQGKLTWPIKGSLLTAFGSLLDDGSHRSMGVMINSQPGTPVRAIYSGKVIFADWLRGYGLLVIINHGHSYMSLYGRNQTIYAKVGNYVKTGDVIASTGNSGGYKRASLYFEVRQNGSPVNPSTWCR